MNPSDPPASTLQIRAYEALNDYFTQHEDEVLEIEILPAAFQPPDGISLQEGLNIGLPKKILALAFVEARQRFFTSIKDGALSNEAYQATKILLLFDPEHLTAANHLKRRLHHLALTSPSHLKLALKRELNFLNSILTSPLHRQSKSPTLWHHRFHLLSYILPSSTTPTTSKKPSGRIPLSNLARFILDELNVVFKAGERHPKNYYAFQYARRLFTAFTNTLPPSPNPNSLPPSQSSSTSSSSSSPNSPSLHTALLRESTLRTRDWCTRNPSDISGWSFFSWLLSLIPSPEERVALVRPVIEYAVRVRLVNESLWVFVRTVVADGTLRDGAEGRDEVLDLLRGYVGEDHGTLVRERIEGCLEWVGRTVSLPSD